MNIITIVQELRAEKAAGNDMAAQMVERIDAHIRDLETLKAWIKDSATARDMALGSMLGMEPEVPATPQVPAVIEPKDESPTP
jgi:hypothetical protein